MLTSAALIQPNFEFLGEWAKRHHKVYSSPEEIVSDPLVQERIQKEVDEANEQFAKWEMVKAFRLTKDPWTVEGGHLTPTMKLRRKIIKEKYLDLYNDIYSHA